MFFAGSAGIFSSFISAFLLTLVILLGILATLLVSKWLSKTILKGLPSSFILELPPYRTPQVWKVIVRSVLDRTLHVLARAVSVAAPAGLLIWCLANIFIGDVNILTYVTNFLEPFGKLIGLDGVILMAFILGLPANEIVMPIILMAYMSTGTLMEYESLGALKEILIANGWTLVTAISTMIFFLFHFPCGTTLWTIYKETQSFKWTVVAFLLPTALGIITCFAINIIGNVFI